MAQNRATGAAANAWGRNTARTLVKALGGKSISSSSNEFTLDGELLVMKSAAPATTSVGVSYEMLRRIDGVIAAFAISASKFELYRMTANAIARACPRHVAEERHPVVLA